MWGMFRMEFEHVHVGSRGGVVSLHLEQTNTLTNLSAATDSNENLKVVIFQIVMGIGALVLAITMSAGVIMGIIYS
jgi:hypothetical protein